MSTKQRYGECKYLLPNDVTECICGWKTRKAIVITDHRCQYQSSGRCCPLPGTMCHHPYGNTWYCSGHWQTLGDPQLGEAVLQDAEKNYHAILEVRRDWRRK
jgi:hypothetical protein